LISIDPDAHSLDGFDDIIWCTGCSKSNGNERNNLSSFGLKEMEAFLLKKAALINN